MTATGQPATTALTSPASTGPPALAAHSIYNYRGLTFVVDLPADVPAAALPRMRTFSDFLQGSAARRPRTSSTRPWRSC